MPVNKNPYMKFMQQSVSTLTPGEMIVKLYEKAERELQKAVYFFENDDKISAYQCVNKVQKIVSTLDAALKVKYEVSDSLAALYEFFSWQLVEAKYQDDPKLLEELIPFFTELRETFADIVKKGA